MTKYFSTIGRQFDSPFKFVKFVKVQKQDILTNGDIKVFLKNKKVVKVTRFREIKMIVDTCIVVKFSFYDRVIAPRIT